MNKSADSEKVSYREILPFIIIVTLVLGFLFGVITTKLVGVLADDEGDVKESSKSFYDESYLNYVYEEIQGRFIGDFPESDETTYGMVKGLITSLDSKYTFFLTPEEAKAYESTKNPDFEGIGVTLKYNGEYTQIESVLKGYPASAAGFLPGDVILEVNEEDMSGKYPSLVAEKVRGPKGSSVTIKIYRQENGAAETKDITVERVKIDIDNVSWSDLGNNIVKIDIAQFNDQSAVDFNKSWDKIVDELTTEQKDLKGVILDLRNNPGGYVYSVKHVLEEFLSDGDVLLIEQSKDDEEDVYVDSRTGRLENVPLIVLVNEGSASASEIFAAAVQFHKRGFVVGTPTVGKGVEQEVVMLEDGSLLMVVFQKWLTPAREQISEEKPIKPDYEVEFTQEDYENGSDPQEKKSLEVLLGR